MTTNSIQFYSGSAGVEVLRLSKDGLWANPEIPVDEAAKLVLDAIDYNIKLLVKKAVEEEREACAKVCEADMERPSGYNGQWEGYGKFKTKMTGSECADAIRARGQE